VVTAEEQVRVEAQLAKVLANASIEERRRLYSKVYDEIYTMHLSRAPETLEFGASMHLVPMLVKLTEPDQRVLEIGCGAGLMAIELARAGRDVTGIDVSNVALERARSRAAGLGGVRFRRVDGVHLPFGDAEFDFAYSIEVLEHLHEIDAVAHLAEVARVLKPKCCYWFLTPSALRSIGTSERFGVQVDLDADVHLKEWTYDELRRPLRSAGFSGATVPLRDHRALALPLIPLQVIVSLERRRLLRRPLAVRLLGLGRCSVLAVRAS
jgi:ubiquinone/menaquinone biosynthesis C-methylase UbiE